MARITIDDREVEVPEGSTVLHAARKLGIDIPTLCYFEGCRPQTSCLVCVVKVDGNPNLVPSCAMPVQDGMKVESETKEVHAVRKTALELILSDHHGDCLAPCNTTCPAHMEIPQMLRQVAAGDLRGALMTIKRDIALPAVLGRVCPEVCERSCRRGTLDHPAAICMVKRYVADADLSSKDPYIPEKKPATGKRVAVVGSGPAGLAAASYLLQDGHAVTIFDHHEKPGGALRYTVPESKLPRDVLDAEIATIVQLGAELRMKTRIGSDISFDDLRKQFDAVFLAIGELKAGEAEALGFAAPDHKVPVSHTTLETQIKGVFAGGDMVRRRKLAVRSIADGKLAAVSIGQYLAGKEITGESQKFVSKMGRLERDEVTHLICGGCNTGDRNKPCGGGSCGFNPEEAKAESLRCIHCDCRKKDDCRLRDYADAYGCSQTRYKGTQRVLEPLREGRDVIYEPGKCIACGLCIQIAGDAKEELGLTYIGRGFNVHVSVPFNGTLSEGLKKAAAECCRACPTGALALRTEIEAGFYPWEKGR